MYRNTCIGWYIELRRMRIMEGTCIISQSFVPTFSSLKQSFSLCKCSVLSGLCGDAHFSCMRHQLGFSIASGGYIFKMAYSQDWWIATHSNWEVMQGFGLRAISCPHRLLHGTDFTFQHIGLKSECSMNKYMLLVFIFLTYFTLYDRLVLIYISTNDPRSFLFMVE